MLFSIITICFNSAGTIRETFDSVLQQDFKDYEYVVVDGASTDGTVDILKEYEPKFEGRLRWISEPDKGIYYAMNKGIGMARGDFLNFLNSDDFFEPETLKIICEAVQSAPGKDVYYGITRFVDQQRGELYLHRKNHNRLQSDMTINHQAIWYNRNVFHRFGQYDTEYKYCADFDHQLRLSANQCTFQPVDRVVVNYRMTGITADNNVKVHSEFPKILRKYQVFSKKDYRSFIACLYWSKWEEWVHRYVFDKFLRPVWIRLPLIWR